MRAPFGRNFFVFTPARITTELRARREDLPFDLFQFIAGARHKLI
jgi:hypothetical protein